MSAIDEDIVREYFEQNGFLVRQVRKYQVQARKKTGNEEIDLIVYNPAWQRGARRPVEAPDGDADTVRGARFAHGRSSSSSCQVLPSRSTSAIAADGPQVPAV